MGLSAGLAIGGRARKMRAHSKESDMAIVGIVALCVVGLIVLAGLVMVGGSVPDIRRYMRIRSM